MDRRWIGLAGWLLLCYSAAAFGSQFTAPEWYRELVRPSWAPPGWVFAPVWTVLYGLMAVAAWLVWVPRGFLNVRLPLGLFGGQLLLNAAWSWIFFGLQRPGLAAVEIVLLWVAVLATAVVFWRVRAAAGALLLPYLAWVSFAAALNVEIWRLN